jgi:signal transduction histidine kinase
MVAATRFLLAASALIIILIDPTEPDRFVFETHAVLILYTVYSLYVFLSVQFGKRLPPIVQHHSWWIDTGSYLVLVSLSSGTNSIFFFFFFFAVLTAAFARGFRTGFAVSAVSAIGFWFVALFTTPGETNFNLSRFLLRPLSLLVLGYLMSRWGGYENRSVRRLELLRQIGTVSNPRFGINRTITVNLELIRAFYDADACLFVVNEPGSETLYAYHSGGLHTSQYPNSLRTDSALGSKLLSPGEDLAALFSGHPLSFTRQLKFRVFDCVTRKFVAAQPAPFVDLFEALETKSLLTTPIYYRKQSIGRVFVYSNRVNVFDSSDIPFLLQTVDYFIPIVENIRLVDRMASDAAEQERKRIARDIHDSIIQPYIGLQIGIESLLHYAEGDGLVDGPLSSRIHRLKQIADQGIEDLRNYVHGLTEAAARRTAFRDSLHRFAEKFTDGTGINVELNYAPGLSVRDRLAAEAFQIVAEAMSNVRKHTYSDVAVVNLTSEGQNLIIEIANKNDGGDHFEFTPKSIASRADSLGGECNVLNLNDTTSVRVSIPM